MGVGMSIGIGNVFSTGIEVFGKRALKLAGLWLIFTIMSYAISIGLILAIGGTGMLTGSLGSMGAGLGIGIGLIYLLSFYITGAQMASMAAMGSRLTSGNFGSSFIIGFSGGLTLTGVFLIFALGFFALAMPFGLFAAGSLADGGGVSAILRLLVFAVIVFLFCRLCLVFPVVGVDNVRNPITAITRSWQITKGHALKIFLILIIFFAILMAFGLILSMLMGGMVMGVAAGGVEDFAAGDIGSMIGMIAGIGIVIALLVSLLAAFTTAIFAAVHSEISANDTEDLEETFI